MKNKHNPGCGQNIRRLWQGLRQSPGWAATFLIIAVLMLTPFLALGFLALENTGAEWAHMVGTILPRSLRVTLVLLGGVGVLVCLFGVGTAWLVTMHRFPARAMFDWALLLPLAYPTYIAAYAWVEIMDFSGPVQQAIRYIGGWQSLREYAFPDIRNLTGAIFVMSFVLYPYVYLTARASFIMQSTRMLEVGRTLGAGSWRAFWRIGLPMARPAIAVGVSLAMMECLNDIGAVEFFGVNTLTYQVYVLWLNRGSLAGAAQLSLSLLVLILALVMLERYARRQQRFFSRDAHLRKSPTPLKGWRAAAAASVCLVTLMLGFLVPTALLVVYSLARLDDIDVAMEMAHTLHSLELAFLTSVVTVAVALVLTYGERIQGHPIARIGGRLGAIGYGVPGTILAIGVLAPLLAIDRGLNDGIIYFGGERVGLVLSGTAVALVYALSVRFLAIAGGTLESGFTRISSHLHMASRTLGRGAANTLFTIHLPLMRPALITAALMVFVDVMKELPVTLLLRPFNYSTLATRIYEQASVENFEDAAPAALLIVLAGLIPVLILAHTSVRAQWPASH